VKELVEMIAKVPGIIDLAMTTNGSLLNTFAHPLKKVGLDRVNISLDTLNPEKYLAITRGGDIRQVLEGIEAARQAGLHPVKINCVVKQSPMEEDAVQVADFCKQNDLDIRFIKEMDLEEGIFSKVIGGDGGHCILCNRLRLTANGKIKPCLFSDLEFDVRELGTKQALLKAVALKPRSGSENRVNKFCNIGG